MSDIQEDEKSNLWITGEEFAKKQIEKPEWLVEDIISKTGATLTVGQPKSSKSMWALNLSICVAEGLPFLNKYLVKQGRVLYIDEENGEVDLQDRYLRMLKAFGIEHANIDFIILKGCKLDSKNKDEKIYNLWKIRIRRYIEERNPSLIICDSLIRFLLGNENQSEDARKVFDFIKEFKNKTAWLLLHHTPRKGKNPRGSSDWEAQCDDVFYLHRRKGEHRFTIKQKFSRRANWIKGDDYQIIDGDDGSLNIKYEGLSKLEDKKKKYEELAAEIIKWLKNEKIENFKRADANIRFNVVKIVGKYDEIPYSRMTEALNYLIKEKILRTDVKGVYHISGLNKEAEKNID